MKTNTKGIKYIQGFYGKKRTSPIARTKGFKFDVPVYLLKFLNRAEARQKTDLKIHIFFDDRLIRIS